MSPVPRYREGWNYEPQEVVVSAVSALVDVPFVSGLAFAADQHKTEALAHAKQAIEQGKGKHADVQKQHAEAALQSRSC